MNTYNVYLTKRYPTKTNRLKKAEKYWRARLIAKKALHKKEVQEISANDFLVIAKDGMSAKRKIQALKKYGTI